MIAMKTGGIVCCGAMVLAVFAGVMTERGRGFSQNALVAMDYRMSRDVRFPVVHGSNLSGRQFELPRDFEGRFNLVFIAWERYQQSRVDSWLPHARDLAFLNPELRVYELPTISPGFLLMSPIIEAGMRGGVTDEAARDATITLYTNRDRFQRALELPNQRTIYVLLLDERGVVRWRTEGPFTAAKGAELDARLERLLEE